VAFGGSGRRRLLGACAFAAVALLLALGAGSSALAPASAAPAASAQQDRAGPAQPGSTGQPLGRTVICLRHAEKEPGSDPDPGLSEAGQARAQALAKLLGGARVTHLLPSSFRRAYDTLAPLAQLNGIEPVVHDPRAPRALEELVAQLHALPPGSLAVVAGHSNTVPALVQALGGTIAGVPAGGQLAETDYGRAFVLVIPPAPARVHQLELRFGE
jgi:broad specificity phosphatase PhoE